ncbi:hypothetical protein EBZ39_06010 [bacterium]|nr:hypothetical protein [bacterium]
MQQTPKYPVESADHLFVPGDYLTPSGKSIIIPILKRIKRPFTRVFIHCSASDSAWMDCVGAMRDIHVKERGWRDVGYHFFIRKDGTLEAGRNIEQTPSAQAGNNTGTIAVCVHGLDIDKFTEAQRQTLSKLAWGIDRTYPDLVTYHGHCEVSSKTCPVFDYRTWLNLDKFGRFNKGNKKDALAWTQ